MRFSRCIDCHKYKYIEKDGMCPSCVRESQNWVVIYHIPHMACRPRVVERDMTEKEAKEKASDDSTLIARPESVI